MSLVLSNSYKEKMSKSYWVYDPENGACPGNCDPAYAMEQSVWRCGCGCWDIVSEAPRYLFPELAKWDGQLLWGDVYMDELEEENQKLDANQRRLRDLLEGATRREADAALARAAALSEIAKAKSILCDRSGKMRKATVMRPCRYFNFKGQLGVAEPGGMNKKGVAWEAGCELHRNGCCEFVHPNQPEWQQILDGARPLSREGQRDFTALLQNKRRF